MKIVEKAQNFYAFICDVCSFAKVHKKLSTVLAVVILVGGGFVWNYGIMHLHNAYNCAYQAWWLDKLENDKWQFNWTGRDWSEQCKRKRHDGTWVSYGKATDFGAGEDTDDVDSADQ